MKTLLKKKNIKKVDFFTSKKYEVKNLPQIIGGSGEEYAEDVDLVFHLLAY